MLKYMLDTNICIFTIKNRPEQVRLKFNLHKHQLIYGAEKSVAPARNLAVVESFAAHIEVLTYDTFTAVHTGQIRAEQARTGQPTGPYDQMIAGYARSCGLIVVTNNTRKFSRVSGLRIEDTG